MTFPIHLDRGHDEASNLNSASSVAEPPSLSKRIFVMKQTGLSSVTDGPVKSVQHILLFDDHPDTLRIVFGRPANWHADDPADDRVSLREFVLPGIAILVALIASCWPLL
jgi:hypothetical protein